MFGFIKSSLYLLSLPLFLSCVKSLLYSIIYTLAKYWIKAVSWARAMGACEPCQDREVAALSGNFHVPWGTREAVLIEYLGQEAAVAAFFYR